MDQWVLKEPDKHRKLDLAIQTGNKKEYNLYISTAIILFFFLGCFIVLSYACSINNTEGNEIPGTLREKQEEKDIQQPRHITICVLFILLIS